MSEKFLSGTLNPKHPRNGRHCEFCVHFGSYINYNYKSETFLMLNKTFEDIFISLLQEYCFT